MICLQAGISALGWSAQGYALVVAEATPGAQNFLELAFARMLPAFHRVSEPLLPSPHHLDAESRSAGGHEAFDAADTDARPTEEEHFVLQAADRLLLVSETLPASVAAAAQAGLIGAGGVEGVNQQPDLVLQHVRLPQHYIDTAFPVLHVAPSPDGRDIAVAGSRGVAVFAHRTRRWRLFGDSVQERKIKVHSLAWLPGGVIAACATIEDGYPVIKGAIQGASAPGPALLLYPKHHLDAASLLARQQLSQLPAAMDAIGPYLALAYEPLRVHVVKADPEGPRIRLTSVRELSILGLGGPLLDMTLLAPSAPETPESTKTSAGKGSKGNLGDQEGPSHCVLLRGGGMLSVLDMQQGSEVVLSDKIEAYWLPSSPGATPALPKMLLPHTPSGGGVGRDDSAAAMQTSPAAKGAAWLERRTSDAAAAAAAALREAAGEAAAAAEEEAVRVEMPWWTFGARGMQLWFPSTFSDPQLSPATAGMGSLGGHTGSSPLAAVAGARGGANATDPELEFDKEVYPLGVSLSEVSIFGIMQRMARSTVLPLGSPAALSFHPHPESQPVLPCLLRRLLEQGQAADALELATRHSKGPHFARSLEWLLFTTLEADADLPKDGTPAARRVRFQREQGAGPQPDSPFSPKSVGKAGRRLARAGPLLIAAARLVEQFPQAAEIVVSVARKTDAQLWPALFAAAGSPAALCDGLLSNGTLQSAACCLLIVDYIEGSAQAHRLALKLVRAALASGSYELTADLLRFLVPPGEGELAGIVDAARSGSGGLGDGPGQAPVEANGGSGTASGEGLASWLWSYFSGADKVVTATMTPSAQHSGEGPTAALHRAVSAASLAESEESHTELTPAIHAWRAMGNHAWRLLDAGALRELAAMGLALGDLHGGLAAVLSTTAGDVPLSLGHTTPSAAAIASALFVASNEFAAADSDADVAVAAQTLLQACYAARCANHVAALSLVLGDAGRLESFSAEHPRVWALLQDLIANDVHLCSFVPVLSPPGTPLLLTESSLGA